MYPSFCVVLLSLLLIIHLGTVQSSESEEWRAINTSGSWTKYNLVVKPTTTTASVVKPAISSPSKTVTSKGGVTTPSPGVTSSSQSLGSSTAMPSPRWEEDEEYAHHADHHEVVPESAEELDDGEEEEEEDEEEDEAADETSYIPHTTQRSKGDRRKRPSSSSYHHHSSPTIKAGKKHHKNYKGYKTKKGTLKKLKKYMFPLLIAYKLKFFTLIPVLLGGLMLIVATTGFAGFFFALFAVGVGLKKD